jgi:hypothetical protein
MSWNTKIPFSKGWNLLQKEVAEGRPQPGRPAKLPRKDIHPAHAVFQPRTFEGSMADSEQHIRNLMVAIEQLRRTCSTRWWCGGRASVGG